MIIKNALVKGKLVNIVTENGVITEITENSVNGDGIDAKGRRVIPGLVETHSHGCIGLDTMDADFERIIHIYATDGEYTYTRTARASESFEEDGAEFCEKSETLQVIIPKTPSLLLEGDDEICVNSENTITASSPDDENTDTFTYQWWYSTQDISTEAPIFEGTQYTQIYTEETTLQVKVTDTETGYNRIETFTVKVEPFPEITLTGATKLCMGEQANITAN